MDEAADAKVAMRTPREPALISSPVITVIPDPMEEATLQHEMKGLLITVLVNNEPLNVLHIVTIVHSR